MLGARFGFLNRSVVKCLIVYRCDPVYKGVEETRTNHATPRYRARGYRRLAKDMKMWSCTS